MNNLLFLICLLLCVVHSSGSEIKDKRVQKLIENDFYLYLTDKNYTYYIESKNRPYNAFVFYSTLDPRYNCDVCVQYRNLPKELAKSYKSMYSSETLTAFVLVYFDHAHEVFSDYKFEYVPQLLFFNKDDKITSKTQYRSYIKYNKQQYSIQSFYDFFNENTHMNLKPNIPREQRFLTLFFISCITIIIAIIMPLGSTFFKATNYKYNWLILICVIFYLCIGGLPYDIINHNELYSFNQQYRKKSSPYIYTKRDPNGQYAFEGFFISTWCILTSIAICFLIYIPNVSNHYFQRNFYALLMITIAFVCLWELWKFYTSKAAWLEPGILNQYNDMIDVIKPFFNQRSRKRLITKQKKYIFNLWNQIKTLFI